MSAVEQRGPLSCTGVRAANGGLRCEIRRRTDWTGSCGGAGPSPSGSELGCASVPRPKVERNLHAGMLWSLNIGPGVRSSHTRSRRAYGVAHSFVLDRSLPVGTRGPTTCKVGVLTRSKQYCINKGRGTMQHCGNGLYSVYASSRLIKDLWVQRQQRGVDLLGGREAVRKPPTHAPRQLRCLHADQCL